MTNDLSITRPLDDRAAEHLDRTFEDAVGYGRDVWVRTQALAAAVTVEHTLMRLTGDEDTGAAAERVLDRARTFERYIVGGVA